MNPATVEAVSCPVGWDFKIVSRSEKQAVKQVLETPSYWLDLNPVQKLQGMHTHPAWRGVQLIAWNSHTCPFENETGDQSWPKCGGCITSSAVCALRAIKGTLHTDHACAAHCDLTTGLEIDAIV